LDTISQKLYVLCTDETRRDNFLRLVAFDTSANLLLSHEIRLIDDNHRPVHAKLKIDESGKLFIHGIYNLPSERQRTFALDNLVSSAGFFSMGFDGTSTQLLLLQNYADFDSVDTRISPEYSQILSQRRNRRQQPFSLDMLMSFHLRTVNNNLALIGESVTREYRTSTQTFYDYYGRVVPYTTTVFDGYRFNDAFIWLLDSNGKARKNYVSDISMTLNSKTLINKIALFVGENGTFILFANATNVFYKTLEPHENSHQTLRLQPLFRGDRVVEDYDSRVFNWYDSHFLVCGYQTIYNGSRRNSKRTVFYLSKISFD
jgi:hypothetical protein